MLAAAFDRWSNPDAAHEGPIARHPALICGSFGLLHGLGFAGALGRAGLPDGAIPLALAGFNVGIELAQLAIIAALLAVARLLAPSLAPRAPRLLRATAWCAGSAGACFLLGVL